MDLPFIQSDNDQELLLFKDLLEAKGIRCSIRAEKIQAHRYYSVPGFRLYIDEGDYYSAQQIIGRFGTDMQEAASNLSQEVTRRELLLRKKIRSLGLDEIEDLQKEFQDELLSPGRQQQIFREEMHYIRKMEEDKFVWDDFLAALFEGRLFRYLNRNRNIKYKYKIEQELIDNLDDEDKE